MNTITQQQLMDDFFYDPESGQFSRLKHSARWPAGTVVGCACPRGYVIIFIKKKCYRAHTLAWLYVNGSFPSSQIDHINGNKGDNRICNLRLATNQQNHFNLGKKKSNTSGYKGVTYVSTNNSWRAKIQINGKTIDLGYHKTPERAAMAYKIAAHLYHQDFFHNERSSNLQADNKL